MQISSAKPSTDLDLEMEQIRVGQKIKTEQTPINRQPNSHVSHEPKIYRLV